MSFFHGNLTEWCSEILTDELVRIAEEDYPEDVYNFSKQTHSDLYDYIKRMLEDCYTIPAGLIDVMLNSIDWDDLESAFKFCVASNHKVVLALEQHDAEEEEQEQTSG